MVGHKQIVVAGLCAGLMWTSGCKDERPVIEFDAEQPLYVDEDVESEPADLAPGAGVGLRTRANIDYHVVAVAEVVGDEVVPDPDGGKVRIFGELEIEPDVDLDIATATVSGAADGIVHEFRSELGRFDPFLIGETTTMEIAMPQDDAQSIRLANIPQIDLILDPAPGSFSVTFGGACLHREGDAIQYTGRITIEPDIRYDASIQIIVPFIEPQTMGPVEIVVPLPPLEDEPIDLGTFSVASRKSLSGMAPCEGMDALPDPDEAATGGTVDTGTTGG